MRDRRGRRRRSCAARQSDDHGDDLIDAQARGVKRHRITRPRQWAMLSTLVTLVAAVLVGQDGGWVLA